ncbi:MAG: hypothetical protein E7585_06295 [Ruminococcaceae bacterium]|nr:hypothetical protein [Oscillospiraceae bacterium]
MNKHSKTKKVLFIIMAVFASFFGALTLVFLFVLPPVGLFGVAITAIYILVAISIKQSMQGKKPIFDMFREGMRTCRKCKKTYPKKQSLTCPYCAKVREFKRKYATIIESKKMPPKDEEHSDFWEDIGMLMILDEIFDDD